MKALEQLGKTLLALFAALLLMRFGRRAKATVRLANGKKILLVRIDNRVGEALLTTPLLDALAERRDLTVHLLVHAKTARVLEGHPSGATLVPLDRRLLALGALAPGIAALRRERYDVVVDCSNWTAPSVTAALVSRLAGPHAAVVGPAAFPVTLLQDRPVIARSDSRSEVAQRLHLLSPLLGPQGPRSLSFRPPQQSAEIARLVTSLGARFAVVNPGGRLGIRRVPAEAFGGAANALADLGVTPLVTFGPSEEGLAAQVHALCPRARLAPPTSIDELAGLMKAATLTVCNNTGPMHLSVAVGTPTLAFFLRMDVGRWGHPAAPHQMVDLTAEVEAGAPLGPVAAAAVRKQLAESRSSRSGGG